METIEYRTIDKTVWGEGPWQSEPDKMQWRDDATGLPCLIVRGPSGALCGYVGVSKAHPWHSKIYSQCLLGDACPDLDPGENYHHCDHTPESGIDVHGGLTFANGCGHGDDESTGVCHVPAAGEPDDVWWFGFDCAHYMDVSPLHRTRDNRGEEGDYRDLAYVKSQVTGLAAQLARNA